MSMTSTTAIVGRGTGSYIGVSDFGYRRSSSGFRPPLARYKCGTVAGVKAHKRCAEALCARCALVQAASATDAKAQPVAGLACGEKRGTPAGYTRHRRHGEPPCTECREANHVAYSNTRKHSGRDADGQE